MSRILKITNFCSMRLLFGLMDIVFLATLISCVLGRPAIPSIDRRSPVVENSDLPPAVSSVCEGGMNATTILNMTSFGTDGVMMTKGMCAPANKTAIASSPEEERGLEERQNCAVAPNNCVSRFGNMFQGHGWVSKCGATCTSSCYYGSGGPNPYDCAHITDSLYNNATKLFVLQPYEFILLTYATCGTGIQNQIGFSSIGCSQTMIYDTQDWSGIGNYLAFNCQSQQGARGGRCTGDTRLFQNVPDYYIQIYRN